jgi:hypothetical protein
MAANMSSGRSIGATTATQNTTDTVNSSVAIAYSNRKTHQKLDAWYFGPGKKPFKYGVVSAICGLLVLVAGLAVLGLRFDGRLLVGSWEGEFIAPCIIISGVLLFALSVWYFILARKKSDAERKKISVRMHSEYIYYQVQTFWVLLYSSQRFACCSASVFR